MSAATAPIGRAASHEERGLACVNCHTIMKSVSRKNQLKTAFEPDTCFQCHKDRRAQMFRSSHMPLREGKIVCSDCHNPHGSFTEALLKKDSINDVCYTCHAEKRGPFLFEHEPVRENCDNCHDPHGSINEYSLKLSRPRLCFECHNVGHAAGPRHKFNLYEWPLLPELPHGNSREQQPGRRCVPAVSTASGLNREDQYLECLVRGGSMKRRIWTGSGIRDRRGISWRGFSFDWRAGSDGKSDRRVRARDRRHRHVVVPWHGRGRRTGLPQ